MACFPLAAHQQEQGSDCHLWPELPILGHFHYTASHRRLLWRAGGQKGGVLIQHKWSIRNRRASFLMSASQQVNVKSYTETTNRKVKCKDYIQEHVVAKVTWLHPHPERHFFGKPVEIWNLQGTRTDCTSAFLPVERIASRCVYNATIVQLSQVKERVSVVIPVCTIVEV